ncbi:hypothetical protein BD324DRAFT_621780 [Kockovaella imperatae]|uniref:Uncharacterized protein n=1 Tax=Kockovaella imperatae TaxID=4999 RepID=A0A1Y1UME9_9TREE|nr:hypothetical protein BD324DRAFT_621780 [Kockovaella imperatae]ORX38646.1 hypothetical protein BD324DRAFT_621780 [Kockovaella imperatae]
MSSAANHLLYILTDSNLPTGGFIASSGLESYVTHGFLKSTEGDARGSKGAATTGTTAKASKSDSIGEWITRFGTAEMDNYASTTVPYLNDAWTASTSYLAIDHPSDSDLPTVIDRLETLDNYHEASLLSHVARRASKAQGVAILMLYVRSFAGQQNQTQRVGPDEGTNARLADELVAKYKHRIRAGKAPGHLSICFAILCAALDLTREQCLHLHLYLHARSVLSSAVRLNQVGPYESTSLLATRFKDLVEVAMRSHGGAGTGLFRDQEDTSTIEGQTMPRKKVQQEFWAWAYDAETFGPATTWPLGEILLARHDLQHTRLFNS